MKKVLVVVAHPDDETIWMGGTLLRNKNWDKTIISLCRRDDSDRSLKFKKACELLGARGFISDLDDSEEGAYKKISQEDIINRVISILQKNKQDLSHDYIFTHGENGEYGHIRHIEVHEAVKSLVSQRQLTCKKLFFFSYIQKNKICCPNLKSYKFINLNPLEGLRKKEIIERTYGFSKNSFEFKSSTNREAFSLNR